MEDTILRRTWAEIDLDALEHNYNVARQKIGPNVKYLGVVKADAYGHGAVQIARKLEQLGADYLAVSSLDEARELRHGGIAMPILILGHTPPEMVPQLIAYNITQAVSAKAKAEAYSAEAVKCGGTLRVHIKVDTGMSRLGFLVRGEHFEGGVNAIAESCALPGLDAEGIFTHFAVSDMDGAEYEAYTREQFGVFTRAELESRSEIMYETYTKVISIEARTMLHMAGKHYIPAVVRNCTRLADSVCKVHTACPAAPTGVQETLLCQTSELLTKAASAEHHLEGLVEQLGRMDNVHDMAVFCHDMIMPAMQDLRDPIDRLELIVDKDIWPVPTYGDLMFEV